MSSQGMEWQVVAGLVSYVGVRKGMDVAEWRVVAGATRRVKDGQVTEWLGTAGVVRTVVIRLVGLCWGEVSFVLAGKVSLVLLWLRRAR